MNAHTKELKCINIARFNRRDMAARALKALAAHPAGFGSYLKSLSLFRHGFGNRADGIKSVVTLPAALATYLRSPWGYREFRAAQYAKHADLELAATEMNRPTREAIAPEEKRLLPLWKLHGLTTDEFRPEDKFLTLNVWLETLYGPGTSRHIRFANRFARNMKRARDTESVTPQIAVREFIAQISRELPPYKSDFHDISILIPTDAPPTASEQASASSSPIAIEDVRKSSTLLFGNNQPRTSPPGDLPPISTEAGSSEEDEVVTVHTLHPDHGYRTSRMRLGVDIDSIQFQRYCDINKEAYGVFTFDGQQQKLQLLGKKAWLKVGDQYRNLEDNAQDPSQ